MQERHVQGIDIIATVKQEHPTITLSDAVLLGYKNRVYSQLYHVFKIEPQNQLEDSCYTLQQQFLVADIVALRAYQDQVASFSNVSTTEKTARTLKKGKAGSAEAEFEQSGDAQFVVKYEKQIEILWQRIYQASLVIHEDLGFIYDLYHAPEWVREAFETPKEYFVGICF